jgi:hypothetical protein
VSTLYRDAAIADGLLGGKSAPVMRPSPEEALALHRGIREFLAQYLHPRRDDQRAT